MSLLLTDGLAGGCSSAISDDVSQLTLRPNCCVAFLSGQCRCLLVGDMVCFQSYTG